MEQSLKVSVIERALFLPQPAITGQGAPDIKAIGLGGIQDGREAQFEHEQGMFEQEGVQLGDVGFAFAQLDEEGFDVGGFRMGRWTGPSALRVTIGKLAPVEEGKKGAVALHDGIILTHQRQGRLVKDGRGWYHESKLLYR